MKKAEDIIKNEVENKNNYLKCSVCGLYGLKDEINNEKKINGNIYVDICIPCEEYLAKGGKLKKRKYFPEELSEIELTEDSSGEIVY